MEERGEVREQNTNDEMRRLFMSHGFEKKRSPREEVIEILTEGLWTLICQGRGPSSGRHGRDASI